MEHDPIVIVGAARTPMGGFQGDFAGTPAATLGAAAITGAQCVPVPHSGHLPHLERPEEFDTLLLDFLRHAKAWLH